MQKNFLWILTFLSLSISLDSYGSEENKWSALSESKALKVEIFPKEDSYSIGDYHQWVISVKDVSDNPVSYAKIGISGGMIGHGHGMPSQPVVSKEFKPGQYLIDGMLFNMMGEWTLLFSIQTPTLNDKVRFDIELKY
jgi:hypothetical protein